MTERNIVMEKNRIKNYEKPRLTFVSLRDEKNVAETCWGGNMGAQNLTWYYDTEGKGYVSFKISAGACALNLANVTYYEEKGGNNGVPLPQGDSKYQELEAALAKSGGNEGTNFKGIKSSFPENPDPKWS